MVSECGAITQKGMPCTRQPKGGQARCHYHGGRGGRPAVHGARRRYKTREKRRTTEARDELDARARVEFGATGPTARILMDVLDQYHAYMDGLDGAPPAIETIGGYLDLVGRAESRLADIQSKKVRSGLDDTLRLRLEAGFDRVKQVLEAGKEAAAKRLAALPEDGWIRNN